MFRFYRLPCLLLLALACLLMAGCGSGPTLGISLEDYVDTYNKNIKDDAYKIDVDKPVFVSPKETEKSSDKNAFGATRYSYKIHTYSIPTRPKMTNILIYVDEKTDKVCFVTAAPFGDYNATMGNPKSIIEVMYAATKALNGKKVIPEDDFMRLYFSNGQNSFQSAYIDGDNCYMWSISKKSCIVMMLNKDDLGEYKNAVEDHSYNKNDGMNGILNIDGGKKRIIYDQDGKHEE